MHHVLHISELLRTILELAVEQPWIKSKEERDAAYHQRSKFLAGAALLCKATSDVALDLLWREQRSFRPLLQLLIVAETDGVPVRLRTP